MRTLVETGVPPAQAAGLAALAAGGPAGHAPADAMISPALLIRAAVRLDAPLLCSMLGDAFARHGVDAAWHGLAVPALRELGANDPALAGHEAVEHMLSGSLLTTLLAVITLAPPARTIRPVVLACAEEEQHVLPVYALHAELAGRGVDVRQLGGRVPRRALAHAVSTVRPAGVFVWSQVPATAQPSHLESLTAGPRIVLGGPGWQDRPLPPAVHLAGSWNRPPTSWPAARSRRMDRSQPTNTLEGGADAGIGRTDRPGRHGGRPCPPRAGGGSGRGGARARGPGRPGR